MQVVLLVMFACMSMVAKAQTNVTISGTFTAGWESIVIPSGGAPYIPGLDTAASYMGATTAGIMLNGAHSRPLSRRADAGEDIFWLSGDWGKDEHSYRNGDLGLAEIGWGRNLGPMQLNLSIGKTWAKQALLQNNKIKAEGTYFHAEALIPVGGSFWATLGGVGLWGGADLRRRGIADIHLPDTETWGLRGRIDWESAINIDRVNLTPYADLSYSETRIDAHTEPFFFGPIRINSSKEKITELRLGLNASQPLSGSTRLLGSLEAVHRFERNGPRNSGQILGFGSFDLPGRDYKQDWLRVCAGIEGRLGDGVASIMLNATTAGEAPSVWLAATWQMRF